MKKPEIDDLGLIIYYFGVYLDEKKKRTLQVCTDIKDFSPGLLTREFGTDTVLRCGYAKVRYMMNGSKFFATHLKCDYIHLQCPIGYGGCRVEKFPFWEKKVGRYARTQRQPKK